MNETRKKERFCPCRTLLKSVVIQWLLSVLSLINKKNIKKEIYFSTTTPEYKNITDRRLSRIGKSKSSISTCTLMLHYTGGVPRNLSVFYATLGVKGYYWAYSNDHLCVNLKSQQQQHCWRG